MFATRRTVASLLGALCALIALATASPVMAQVTYQGQTDTLDGPFFIRPNEGNPPSTMSTVTTAYHTYSFTPTETAQYRIVSTVQAPNWNNYIFVYSGAVDPDQPLVNVLAGNNDFGNTTTAGIDAIPLQANQTYTILVCGSTATASGNFETVITQLPPTVATTGGPTWNRPDETHRRLTIF